MKKLIVCGATGRMGKTILGLAAKDKEWKVVGKVDRKNSLGNCIQEGEMIIDFTLPEGALNHLRLAIEHHKPIVIGTTGFSKEQQELIKAAGAKTPIVMAPNMSVGVNVLLKLIEQAAKSLGEDYEVAIEETHHAHKKDAPSGTAKAMGTIVYKQTGKKPPIDSLREGEVVGDHTIVFGSPYEHLVLEHTAIDRKVFAKGALRAAKWLLDKKPGFYSMADVLDI